MTGTGDWQPYPHDDKAQAGGPPPGYPGMPPPAHTPDGYGKPGVIPLRPLTVGDILGGAISAIRRYPALILGVSAAVALITVVLGLVLLWNLVDQLDVLDADSTLTDEEQAEAILDALPALLGLTAGTVIISLMASTFLAGFLTVVVGDAVLGRPTSFAAALDELKPRLLPLLGLTVLYGLIVLVGTIACIVPGVWLYVLFAFASPALILERQSLGTAFSRSRELVAGNWWRSFGILLLAAILAALVSNVISLVFGFVGGGSGAVTGVSGDLSAAGTVVQGVGDFVAATLVAPFTAIVTVLLYTDLRIRKEQLAFHLARDAGLLPPDAR